MTLYGCITFFRPLARAPRADYPRGMEFSDKALRSCVAKNVLPLLLALGLATAHAAEPEITGRYVAKDAEILVEKAANGEYKIQYAGKCIREGEPFEFYTNGKARKLTARSFVISVTTSRVPSCARFAPLDGQDHILETTVEDPSTWHFKKNEPSWLSKQAFIRQK